MKTNRLAIGILAHVDAGKTTLSEALLYTAGVLRKMGRVDHKDAYLDTEGLEKDRGITIFSKQAVFPLGSMEATLVDTPGHVDFSSEMERTLGVLDYAILVINGADGIQGHTLTLWKLLARNKVPVFLFVNKMDQPGTSRQQLLAELRERFGDGCVDFSGEGGVEALWEAAAMSHESLLESYLEKGRLEEEEMKRAIAKRWVHPVFFGSALKNQGVKELYEAMARHMDGADDPGEFGAKVFKISRDAQGTRLAHMKITGGTLRVKDAVDGDKEQKADEIRIYSGRQFEQVQEAGAGTICAVAGFGKVQAGDGLGFEQHAGSPALEPVLSYRMVLPEDANPAAMLRRLRELEEEEPHLGITWNEAASEIHAQVMGEVEMEVLSSIIQERYGVKIGFDSGSLVYKETIAKPVIGIGHFEPLRHYAEVHLLLEPLPPGSGIRLASACSVDQLAGSWQRLALSHLAERHHPGVLAGADITDMRITLVAGKAHEKHTEGGDFRQATYRALRQGLMQAESILLEPVYDFRLELPKELLGKAISDIQRMEGTHEDPAIEGEQAFVIGKAPVAAMRHYALEVAAYTKGMGRLALSPGGYAPCAAAGEVIEAIGYDPSRDVVHPADSIFCSHGAGYAVPWQEVASHCHVDSGIRLEAAVSDEEPPRASAAGGAIASRGASDEELEAIFLSTYGPSKRSALPPGGSVAERRRSGPARDEAPPLERYLLVDGYNILFAWEELKDLAGRSLDAARTRLMDILCSYQAMRHETVILVFDAYKVKGGLGSMEQYHNIHVVYTKEAETADEYIERLAASISPRHEVVVATSDAVEQMIILGQGAQRLSAEGLLAEVDAIRKLLREEYLDQEKPASHQPFKDIGDRG